MALFSSADILLEKLRLNHWFYCKLYTKMKKKVCSAWSSSAFGFAFPALFLGHLTDAVSFSFHSASQGALTLRERQCLLQKREGRPGSQRSQLHYHLLWVPFWGFFPTRYLVSGCYFFRRKRKSSEFALSLISCWVAMLRVSDALALAMGMREHAHSSLLPGLPEAQLVMRRSLSW